MFLKMAVLFFFLEFLPMAMAPVAASGQIHGSFSFQQQGLQLGLSQQGINALKQRMLGNFRNRRLSAHIPILKSKGDYGLVVTLQDMKVMVEIRDLHLIAHDGYLLLHLKLTGADVKISRLNVKRRTVIGEWSLSCGEVRGQVTHSPQAPLHLTTRLFPYLKGGKLGISAKDTQFAVTEKNYHIWGPGKCSGGPLEEIIKMAMNKALLRSRFRVQQMVRKSIVPRIVKHMALKLNHSFRKNLTFEWRFPTIFSPSSKIKVVVTLSPRELQVSKGRLFLSIQWRLQEVLLVNNPLTNPQATSIAIQIDESKGGSPLDLSGDDPPLAAFLDKNGG